MAHLVLRDVAKRYPRSKAFALSGASVAIERNEVVALVGASGSGKSTLIRIVAGFEEPTRGEVAIDGTVISRPGWVQRPEVRQMGIVVPGNSLFPHLTVQQNITYGLLKTGRRERRLRMAELLHQLALPDDAASRYPHELSSGQQQRVALARALAPNPPLLLLDEPFSNLDSTLRARLRDQVSLTVARESTTVLWITHDVEDALAVADRIMVLRRGQIEQFGTPRALLDAPATAYVARLMFRANVFPVMDAKRFFPSLADGAVDAIGPETEGQALCVPPRQFVLGDEGVPCKVLRAQYCGDYVDLFVRFADGADAEPFHIHVSVVNGAAAAKGTVVKVRCPKDPVWLPDQ